MSGDEEIELEPHVAATVPFVQTTATTPPASNGNSVLMPPASPNNKNSPPGNNLLKTPQAHRNGSITSGSRRGSLLSVGDVGYDGSRRPSALDILSHAGSETAAGSALGWGRMVHL